MLFCTVFKTAICCEVNSHRHTHTSCKNAMYHIKKSGAHRVLKLVSHIHVCIYFSCATLFYLSKIMLGRMYSPHCFVMHLYCRTLKKNTWSRFHVDGYGVLFGVVNARLNAYLYTYYNKCNNQHILVS